MHSPPRWYATPAPAATLVDGNGLMLRVLDAVNETMIRGVVVFEGREV